jgi:dTDP-4-amino-4,6-dideoxygalactose transaminase
MAQGSHVHKKGVGFFLKVELLDLSGQYRGLRREVLREIQKVCDSQRFILGENVSALEREMAAYCGVRYAISVASGSDAIRLALMASGVGPGDRVVTTPYTFFATAGSIALVGAVPVFVDIEPESYNIDTDKLARLLESKKNKNIKAVIPVHLFGQCADMAPVKKIARSYNLKVIEDAAQAIGAEYRNRRAGSLGDIGCFSFYPSKNLGCFGDGGMVTTNNRRTAELVKIMRVHGSRTRYLHTIVGTNSRLDEIQAAVLRVKLKYLEAWTKKRIKNAGIYKQLFQQAALLDLVTPPTVGGDKRSVFHQYVVRVKKRDRLREFLLKHGIGTEVYYQVPLHLQRCFQYLGHRRGDFPASEKAARQTLALPVYPELKKSELRYVVSTIKRFYTHAG